MPDTIQVDSEESIAAVHIHGTWRFFYDSDYMFLLDYQSYPGYTPKPGESRYGTLIVDDSNVEQWMRSLKGELTVEQIPHVRWGNGGQVKLTFLIDFDRKLWIGYKWNNDQSSLTDYQPSGWIAIEDDVFRYLPQELSKLWDKQLIKTPVIAALNDDHSVLIRPGTRAGDWGTTIRGIDTTQTAALRLSIIRVGNGMGQQARDVLFQQTLTDLPSVSERWIDLHLSYRVSPAKETIITIAYYQMGKPIYLGTIAELGPYQFD
jgi:hypothetical protein